MDEPELWLRPLRDRRDLVDQCHRERGRVGLDGLLDRLSRRGRVDDDPPAGASWSMRFDDEDEHDERWFPQGLTHSGESGAFDDRPLLWSAAYCRGPRGLHLGTRLSLVDLTDDDLRYDHVHLAEPVRDPLTRRVRLLPVVVHAGGIAWHGRRLYLADTWGGFRVFDVDDVVEATGAWSRRTDHLLVQSGRYAACHSPGTPRFHYSFASVDRTSCPPRLVTGEYLSSNSRRSARLMAYDLGADGWLTETRGRVVPHGPAEGTSHMQGVAHLHGRTYVSCSRGAHRAGSLCWRDPGDDFREIMGIMSVGCEDLSYDGSTDMLWCQGEYPGRRHVYTLPRPGAAGWGDDEEDA